MMNIPALHRRIVAITLVAYFVILAVVGATSYWIMTEMPNPGRDGFLLLALASFALAASLSLPAVLLNALIAGGWSGRTIQNIAKAARYLAILKLLVAFVWLTKALLSA